MKIIKSHILLSFIFIFTMYSSIVEAQQLDTKVEILARIQAPTFPERTFSVLDFGASPDSGRDSKPAFDRAILACKAAGGGHVIVPKGDYFLEGPLHLESNLNLVLKAGSTLRFSSNPNSYPNVLTSWEGTIIYNYSPFIYAYQKENIAITGSGTIDGESAKTFAKWHGKQKTDQLLTREMNHKGIPFSDRQFGKGHFLRPQLIQFFECKNILMEDVHIEDSPFWCVHLLKCENATLRGLSYDAQNKNNDGIDPEYSKDILIENITFNNNDDNVAIKAGRDHEGRAMKMPTENIIIRNCHFKGLHAVVIGSEMSSNVRNIFVENSDYTGYVKRGVYIKSNPDRGGQISDVFVNNVEFGNVLDCFMITSNYHNEGAGFPTRIKNINLNNLKCKRAENYGVYIKGHPLKKVQDINIKNMTVDEVGRDVFVDFADDISFKNLEINGKVVKANLEKLKENPSTEYDY
ncbi:glycoside hydrolase family 28 protein [Formosa sp. 4Alg 33]|uniref:glycoside hydrolase family 28 protein n=1 Tax=Formosa sp. 4Alg 33 TaxID=3382189 RepID=UPI003D9C14BF